MKAVGLKFGLVMTLLLFLPVSAHAKGTGLDHVTLEGPGIGDLLLVEKGYPYVFDDAISTHVFGSETRRDIGRDRPNRGDLGPRFELSYHMTFGEPIEIDLYPYTDRGPVAYATPGQSVLVPVGNSGKNAKFPVKPGWYDYKPAIVDILREQGLPTMNETDQEASGTLFFVTIIVFGSSLVLVWAHKPGRQNDAVVMRQASV